MPASHNQATQVTSPTHWASVKVALIKSIREGVLFDRKYWARHSKTGDALKPVYFSNVIMGDKVQQLNNCTSKFGYRFAEVLRDHSGEIPQGSKHSHNRPRGRYQRRQRLRRRLDRSRGWGVERGGEGGNACGSRCWVVFSVRALPRPTIALRNDEFPSWKSLLFYRCTDVISFAPLKSQGADSRLNYIREKTTADAPPPCSPKSTYVLAKLVRQPQSVSGTMLTSQIKLGIQPLWKSALADIKSKVSLDNVVDEVFSWVTSGCVPLYFQPRVINLGLTRSLSQKEIMEMECELLISNFKNPKTIGHLKEKIGYISDGSSPHCAGALKLGLKKAIEHKKRERGVLLRCRNYSCGWHHSPVSYSSVGSNTHCLSCGTYCTQCTGCGYDRTSNYTSCQSCGKRFM